MLYPIDGNQSSSLDSVLKTDSEEECSFLKIENVVSLAPRADNDSAAESPIVSFKRCDLIKYFCKF